VPYLSAAGELKTKPTQHSVKSLLEYGVQPDVLVCRTEKFLNKDLRKKIALFCNVNPNAVIESMDAETIYDVPLLMQDEQLDLVVLQKLGVTPKSEPNLEKWQNFLSKLKNPNAIVRIGLVGKYIELKDSYKSIVEAFIHAGVANNAKVQLDWIHSEDLIDEGVIEKKLKGLKGILVAPGFGERGIEGKINAIKYARTNNLPFFGICLGMQCAVIEFARNVLGLKDAHSYEMNRATPYPVIDLMEEQKTIINKGGTMRLGAYDCKITPGTLAHKIYNSEMIKERHRHRFEFNNQFVQQYQSAGMVLSGINPENNLVEIIELPHHPFFIGVQFHPEYKSTVENPHPVFVKFVEAALKHV
jgi:CTP synthase